MRNASLILSALVLPLAPLSAMAQWRTQTIELRPGWNAVHVEVQPAPDDCDTLFAALPVESVWKWNRRFTSIQFVEDPQTLLAEDPDWLVWLPLSSENAFLRRLRSLQANQSYLIKVAAGASPVSLSLKGKVVMPRLDWYPHGLNLVGFPVHPANPPTMATFFEFTDEIDTVSGFKNELFRLTEQGKGERIVQPGRVRLQAGVAYWIATDRKVAHMGPLHVSTFGGELDFGAATLSKKLEIQNTHPNQPRDVVLRLLPSESPPQGVEAPELAGPLVFSYLDRNAAGAWSWAELPAAGLTRTLGPGEVWTLQIGLQRDQLTPFPRPGANGAEYQGVLEVTDAAQSLRILVPARATSPALASASRLAAPASGGLGDFNESAGLWVGEVVLDRVNAPAWTTDTVIPAPAPMSLRLLVHVDSSGNARLLQEVLLAWDATLTDAPHTNGTYALYASEAALPPAASDVRRISSVGFPIMAPAPMSGAFTNGLSAVVEITFDNPTNPFLHRYHPRHDNKDWDFAAYSNAVEVPDIRREINLVFTPASSAQADPIWGVDAVGGTYTETVSGLRAQPVVLQGAFSLQRVSRIDQLQSLSP